MKNSNCIHDVHVQLCFVWASDIELRCKVCQSSNLLALFNTNKKNYIQYQQKIIQNQQKSIEYQQSSI